MTNGENLKNIYPDLEIIREVKDVYVIMLETHNVCSPKLEVFKSWWNAEYKEPSSSEKPNRSEIPTGSDDCISRVEALNCLKATELKKFDWIIDAREKISNLPPITPIRPKGHWTYDKSIANWICSKCGETPKTIGYVGTGAFMAEHFKYCNHCGAEMEGSEEV